MGSAHNWLNSYLSGRSNSVRVDSSLNFLFSSPKLCSWAISPSNIEESLINLQPFLSSFRSCFFHYDRALNSENTEVKCFGTIHRRRSLNSLTSIQLADASVLISDHIKLFGITLDERLNLNKHVSIVCSISYFHIRVLHHSYPHFPWPWEKQVHLLMVCYCLLEAWLCQFLLIWSLLLQYPWITESSNCLARVVKLTHSAVISLLSCVSIPYTLFHCSPVSVFLILIYCFIALLCRYSSSIISLLSCVGIPHPYPLFHCSPLSVFLIHCFIALLCRYSSSSSIVSLLSCVGIPHPLFHCSPVSVFLILIHYLIALLCRYSSSIISLLSCVSIPHPLFHCSPVSVFLILIHCFIAILCRYSSSIVSLLSCVSIPHPLFNCSPMSVFLILVHYLIALLCRYSSSIVSLLSCVDIPHPLFHCYPVSVFLIHYLIALLCRYSSSLSII